MNNTLHLSSYIHPWVSMVLAIIFELTGTITAKSSAGLTKLRFTLAMLASYWISVSFLALALDSSTGGLDLGVAYATWSGLGTIVSAIFGVMLFGETLEPTQYVGIVLTIVGVTMVNMKPSFNNSKGKEMYGDDASNNVVGQDNNLFLMEKGAIPTESSPLL